MEKYFDKSRELFDVFVASLWRLKNRVAPLDRKGVYKHLERAMRRGSRKWIDRKTDVVPNIFAVRMAPGDYERLIGSLEDFHDVFIRELKDVCSTKGYSLRGNIEISFHEDDTVLEGRALIDAWSQNNMLEVSATDESVQLGIHDGNTVPYEKETVGYPDTTVRYPAATVKMSVPSLLVDDKRIYLDEDSPIPVGRAPWCAVCVEDELVSREHAEFVLRQGVVTVSDLDSMNGTYVNGKRIDKPTKLENGDYIEIDVTRIEYES